jgi:hypothetical protein
MHPFARCARTVAPRLALAVSSVLVLPANARAAPPEKTACAAAYERSQELRASGKMRAAQETLVQCADPACPGFIQTDCTQWLVEVQRDTPTVVFAARDQRGEETVHVTISVDGAVLVTELDGQAVALDPGLHTFRFELPGAAPVEQKYLIRQGQKARVIEASFAPRGGDLPDSSPYVGPPPAVAVSVSEPEAPPANKAPLRPYAYIAGGIGVAGVVGFAVLGAVGKSREHHLRDTCGDTCNPSDVDAVRTKYILADISLGVGIAGLVTGVVLFVLSEHPRAPDAVASRPLRGLDVRTTHDAAMMTYSGVF